MGSEFRVRDPIHDFVTLYQDEVRIIDAPVFQRLRGIRQLALANLVYPGALHTRFDHSVGVCHVAGMMARSLGLEPDDERLVRLAALLHDLGHGPFSHVSEDALEIFAKRQALKTEQKKEKIHELITAELIRTNRDLIDILGVDKCERIAKLLGDGDGEPVLRNIVSGPLDADKQDYLLRDSRFCGVPYGMYDIHQLHGCFTCGGERDDRSLWIREDGVHAVEQYVLAKYYMTTMVYRHHVRLITDSMIARAIVLGIEKDDNSTLAKLYSFDNAPEFVKHFVEWDDARFLSEFGGASKGLCGDILDRLTRRRLFKRVFRSRLTDFTSPGVREWLSKLPLPENREAKIRIEQRIAGILNEEFKADFSGDFVVINVFSIKSVRKTSRDDEAGILVESRRGPLPFDEASTLFKSINESYTDENVEVYAAVTWANPSERKRLRDRVNNPICEAFEAECDSTKEKTRSKP